MVGKRVPIAVAEGDGIGPEIMAATLHILAQAGAALDIHRIEIGEKVYLQGIKEGITAQTWETIRHTEALLKAPITTPQGGGFKSLNVTIRTSLGLYANVRPCISYYPIIKTKHPGMDVVIIRENEEDLYTGIEYHQTPDTYHALKVITRPASEKIIRYAFDYAVTHKRKKVTCFTKDNILKLSDGLFHKVFDEIAQQYPSIENEHWIVDIGAAKLADTPTAFDVLVLPNLYGDILSDVAAQIAGSVGLAGSANIGDQGAMFEAIHGSAPRRAGQNLANPSGLLLAAVLMLAHIGQPEVAKRIHNAWLTTLEDGLHTYDIFTDRLSKKQVGTKEFAEAVVERLGATPQQLKQVEYAAPHQQQKKQAKYQEKIRVPKQLEGVDIFIYREGSLEGLMEQLKKIDPLPFELSMIRNRGTRVWPHGMHETFCVDNWCCRYLLTTPSEGISHRHIAELLHRLADVGLDFTSVETLCSFDSIAGYTRI